MNARSMTDTDRRYVVSTWAQSARYGGMAKRDRFRLVDRIIDGGARVVVLANGPTVHAWACGEGDTLHYVYVPPELRRNGVARIAIHAALGSYPARISVTHPWPRPSARFCYAPHILLREVA